MKVIFCYHKVGPEPEVGRWLAVEPDMLKKHIQALKRWHFRFGRIDEFDKTPPESKIAYLTFDDCYASTMNYGVRALNEERVKGSFYAVSQYVGDLSRWDEDRPAPLASWEQLRSAFESGHEIGNHTVTHPMLGQIMEQDQRTEIFNAKRDLESHGLWHGSICYPYGSVDGQAMQVAREAGYKFGVSLRRGPVTTDSNMLALPRITMSMSDGIPALLYKIKLKPSLDKLVSKH